MTLFSLPQLCGSQASVPHLYLEFWAEVRQCNHLGEVSLEEEGERERSGARHMGEWNVAGFIG